MSERTKKIIFIIIFLVITILLGYLIYYLFLKPAPSVPPENINEIFPEGLPGAEVNVNRPTYINVNGRLIPAANINVTPPSEVSTIAQGGITQVTTLANVPTSGATLASNNRDLLYYNQSDGKFYKIDSAGNISLLIDKVFHDVDSIYWAPDKEKVILEYPDGSNIVYNFTTDKQVTLPKHWKDFTFSPTSKKIAFKSWTVDKEDRWLAISSDDGSTSKKIEALGDVDETVHVEWSPNKQIIATFTEGRDLDRQYLFFVGLHEERFNATIIEGWDYRSQWSPEGERLLYSVYNRNTNLNPTLWIVDAKGENIGNNRTPLYLQTWADKCTFADANILYCAVPQYLEKGSGLIPEVAANVADDFYKIDLRTYSKTLMAVPDGSYNASNLTLSGDGRYLYFVDQNSGNLHQLRLK